MIGGSCREGGVIYLNSSAGAVDPRDVQKNRTDRVSYKGRVDNYDCSDILDNSQGNWNHFCHVEINDCQLTLKCYDHDRGTGNSAPLDTMTLDGCSP